MAHVIVSFLCYMMITSRGFCDPSSLTSAWQYIKRFFSSTNFMLYLKLKKKQKSQRWNFRFLSENCRNTRFFWTTSSKFHSSLPIINRLTILNCFFFFVKVLLWKVASVSNEYLLLVVLNSGFDSYSARGNNDKFTVD